MFRKTISILVIVTFLGQSLLYAQPQVTDLEPAKEFRPNAINLVIPQELGEIDSSFFSPPSSGILVHIQDAHGNYDAQKNIQKIVSYLQDNYGIKTLFLEGGAEKLDPSPFHLFENQDWNLETADLLAKHGFFTGAEMHLLSSSSATGYGIEDIDLYRRDAELFREVMNAQPETEKSLKDLEMKLRQREAKVFSNELKEFVNEWRAHQNDPSNLARYFNVLEKKSRTVLSLDLSDRTNQIEFPSFTRLVALKDLEAKVDMEQVEKERKEFLTFLKGKVEDSLLSVIASDGRSPERGNLRFAFEKLYDALSEKKITLPIYPAFARYIANQILQSECQSQQILDESELLTHRIFATLAQTNEEKKLVQDLKDFVLLRKLLSLELTRGEWEEVKLRMSNDELRMKDESKTAFSSTFDIRNSSFNFYRLAERRESAFLQKTFEVMKQTNQARAALVTGGFHTEGLEAKLKSLGLSYVSIRPHVGDSVKSREIYLQSMMGKNLSIEESQLARELALNRLEVAKRLMDDGRFINFQRTRNQAVRIIRKKHAASLGAEQIPGLDDLVGEILKGIDQRIDVNLPYVIGIGAAAGTGKSTFAGQLKAQLEGQGKKVYVLGFDSFLKMPGERKQLIPGWFDIPELKNVLKVIKRGERKIATKFYSRVTKQREPTVIDLVGTDVVIFEGLYAISNDPQVGNFLEFVDLPVYMTVDETTRKRWRFEQEAKKPHPRTPEEMEHHWSQELIPDSIQNIYPSKANARFLIDIGSNHEIKITRAAFSLGRKAKPKAKLVSITAKDLADKIYLQMSTIALTLANMKIMSAKLNAGKKDKRLIFGFNLSEVGTHDMDWDVKYKNFKRHLTGTGDAGSDRAMEFFIHGYVYAAVIQEISEKGYQFNGDPDEVTRQVISLIRSESISDQIDDRLKYIRGALTFEDSTEETPVSKSVEDAVKEIEQIIPRLANAGYPMALMLPTAEAWIAWDAMEIMHPDAKWILYMQNIYLHEFEDALLIHLGILGPHLRQQADPADMAVYPMALAVGLKRLQGLFQRLDALPEGRKKARRKILEEIQKISRIIFSALLINPNYNLYRGESYDKSNRKFPLSAYKKQFNQWMDQFRAEFRIPEPKKIIRRAVQTFPELLGSKKGELPLYLQFADKREGAEKDQTGQELIELFMSFAEDHPELNPDSKPITIWDFFQNPDHPMVQAFMRDRNRKAPKSQLEFLTKVRDALLSGALFKSKKGSSLGSIHLEKGEVDAKLEEFIGLVKAHDLYLEAPAGFRNKITQQLEAVKAEFQGTGSTVSFPGERFKWFLAAQRLRTLLKNLEEKQKQKLPYDLFRRLQTLVKDVERLTVPVELAEWVRDGQKKQVAYQPNQATQYQILLDKYYGEGTHEQIMDEIRSNFQRDEEWIPDIRIPLRNIVPKAMTDNVLSEFVLHELKITPKDIPHITGQRGIGPTDLTNLIHHFAMRVVLKKELAAIEGSGKSLGDGSETKIILHDPQTDPQNAVIKNWADELESPGWQHLPRERKQLNVGLLLKKFGVEPDALVVEHGPGVVEPGSIPSFFSYRVLMDGVFNKSELVSPDTFRLKGNLVDTADLLKTELDPHGWPTVPQAVVWCNFWYFLQVYGDTTPFSKAGELRAREAKIKQVEDQALRSVAELLPPGGVLVIVDDMWSYEEVEQFKQKVLGLNLPFDEMHIFDPLSKRFPAKNTWPFAVVLKKKSADGSSLGDGNNPNAATIAEMDRLPRRTLDALAHINQAQYQFVLARRWDLYAIIGMKAHEAGELALAPELDLVLDKLAEAGEWEHFVRVIREAMAERIITQKSQVDRYLEVIKTRDPDKLTHYAEVVGKAIEEKIINRNSDLVAYLQTFADSTSWFSYADLLVKSIDNAVIRKWEELKPYLDQIGSLEGAADVLCHAIKTNIPIEEGDLEPYLKDMKELRLWHRYAQVQTQAYQSGVIREKPDLLRIFEDSGMKNPNPVLLNQAIEAGVISTADEVWMYLEKYKEQKMWDAYTDVLLKAAGAGIFRTVKAETIHKPEVSAILSELLMGHTDVYIDRISRAMELKVITTYDELKPYLDNLFQLPERPYEKLLIAAMKHDVIRKREELDPYLELMRREGTPGGNAKVLIQAYEKRYGKRIINRKPNIRPYLDRLDLMDQYPLFADMVIRAMEMEIITEKHEVDLYLDRLRLAGKWGAYANVLKKALENGIYDVESTSNHVVHQLADQNSLAPSFISTLARLKQVFSLDHEAVNGLLGQAVKVLGSVWEKNQKAEREDQKIDFVPFRNHLLPAFANLSIISPNLTGQVLDRYLEQRGYLPMLRDIFETVAFLEPDEVRVLQKFYRATGGRFISNPNFLVTLVGYMNAYADLGLGLAQFEKDLMENIASVAEISSRLGRKAIHELARQLGIEISPSPLPLSPLRGRGQGEEGVSNKPRDIVNEWDFRYLGLLIAAKTSWREEEKAFFNLLLKSALEGNVEGLIYPPDYANISKETFGEENQETVERIRRHNLNLLKEMEALGLRVNAWLLPNQTIPASFTSGNGTEQRDAADILRDFRRALNAFEAWLAENPSRDGEGRWAGVKQSLGTWARLDAQNPSVNTIKNKETLKRFEGFISHLRSHFPLGGVPEPIADLEILLDAIRDYDVSKKPAEDAYRIRFWNREPGRDIFLGNQSGSCTALGSNASAIFEYLLDQGTQYAVIEDLKGNVKGYARFFLGLDGSEKPRPVLFVDSVDGILAGKYFGEIKAQIVRFAEKIGLEAKDVKERDEKVVKQKVGGVITETYLHHVAEGVKFFVEEPDSSIDHWVPRGGWPVAASLGETVSAQSRPSDYGFIASRPNRNSSDRSSYKRNNLLENSRGVDFPSSNRLREDFNASKFLGGIFTRMIPAWSEFIGFLAKSVSWVIKILFSEMASWRTFPLEIPLGDSFASYLSSLRNIIKSWWTFSSIRKSMPLLQEGRLEFVFFEDFGRVVQGGFDMVGCQFGIRFANFLSAGPVFQHFKNQINHNPRALKARLSVTDLGIHRNVLFHPIHKLITSTEGYHSFKLLSSRREKSVSDAPGARHRGAGASLGANEAESTKVDPEIVKWTRMLKSGGAFAGGETGLPIEITTFLQRFLNSLGLKDKDQILDIGTGNQAALAVAKEVAGQAGKTVRLIGIDKAKPGRILDGVDFFQVPGERLSEVAAPQSLRAAIGVHAIEYMNVGEVLRELNRALEPEGRAAFVMHHADSTYVSGERHLYSALYMMKKLGLMESLRAFVDDPKYETLEPVVMKHLLVERVLNRMQENMESLELQMTNGLDRAMLIHRSVNSIVQLKLYELVKKELGLKPLPSFKSADDLGVIARLIFSGNSASHSPHLHQVLVYVQQVMSQLEESRTITSRELFSHFEHAFGIHLFRCEAILNRAGIYGEAEREVLRELFERNGFQVNMQELSVDHDGDILGWEMTVTKKKEVAPEEAAAIAEKEKLLRLKSVMEAGRPLELEIDNHERQWPKSIRDTLDQIDLIQKIHIIEPALLYLKNPNPVSKNDFDNAIVRLPNYVNFLRWAKETFQLEMLGPMTHMGELIDIMTDIIEFVDKTPDPRRWDPKRKENFISQLEEKRRTLIVTEELLRKMLEMSEISKEKNEALIRKAADALSLELGKVNPVFLSGSRKWNVEVIGIKEGASLGKTPASQSDQSGEDKKIPSVVKAVRSELWPTLQGIERGGEKALLPRFESDVVPEISSIPEHIIQGAGNDWWIHLHLDIEKFGYDNGLLFRITFNDQGFRLSDPMIEPVDAEYVDSSHEFGLRPSLFGLFLPLDGLIPQEAVDRLIRKASGRVGKDIDLIRRTIEGWKTARDESARFPLVLARAVPEEAKGLWAIFRRENFNQEGHAFYRRQIKFQRVDSPPRAASLGLAAETAGFEKNAFRSSGFVVDLAAKSKVSDKIYDGKSASELGLQIKDPNLGILMKGTGKSLGDEEQKPRSWAYRLGQRIGKVSEGGLTVDRRELLTLVTLASAFAYAGCVGVGSQKNDGITQSELRAPPLREDLRNRIFEYEKRNLRKPIEIPKDFPLIMIPMIHRGKDQVQEVVKRLNQAKQGLKLDPKTGRLPLVLWIEGGGAVTFGALLALQVNWRKEVFKENILNIPEIRQAAVSPAILIQDIIQNPKVKESLESALSDLRTNLLSHLFEALNVDLSVASKEEKKKAFNFIGPDPFLASLVEWGIDEVALMEPEMSSFPAWVDGEDASRLTTLAILHLSYGDLKGVYFYGNLAFRHSTENAYLRNREIWIHLQDLHKQFPLDRIAVPIGKGHIGDFHLASDQVLDSTENTPEALRHDEVTRRELEGTLSQEMRENFIWAKFLHGNMLGMASPNTQQGDLEHISKSVFDRLAERKIPPVKLIGAWGDSVYLFRKQKPDFSKLNDVEVIRFSRLALLEILEQNKLITREEKKVLTSGRSLGESVQAGTLNLIEQRKIFRSRNAGRAQVVQNDVNIQRGLSSRTRDDRLPADVSVAGRESVIRDPGSSSQKPFEITPLDPGSRTHYAGVLAGMTSVPEWLQRSYNVMAHAGSLGEVPAATEMNANPNPSTRPRAAILARESIFGLLLVGSFFAFSNFLLIPFLTPAMKVYSWYPLIGNAVTGALGAVIGSFLAQRIEIHLMQTHQNYEWGRMLRQIVPSVFFFAPIYGVLIYGWAMKFVPGIPIPGIGRTSPQLAQALLDQMILAPLLFNPVNFFIGKFVFEKNSFSQSIQLARQNLKQFNLAAWFYWIPAIYTIMSFENPMVQFFVANTIGMVWGIFFTIMIHFEHFRLGGFFSKVMESKVSPFRIYLGALNRIYQAKWFPHYLVSGITGLYLATIAWTAYQIEGNFSSVPMVLGTGLLGWIALMAYVPFVPHAPPTAESTTQTTSSSSAEQSTPSEGSSLGKKLSGEAVPLNETESHKLALQIAQELGFQLFKPGSGLIDSEFRYGDKFYGHERWVLPEMAERSVLTQRFSFVRIGYLFFLEEEFYAQLSEDLRKQLAGNVILMKDLGASFIGSLNHPIDNTVATVLVMLNTDLSGKRVIDAGAADGVLSLVASKLGAKSLVLIEKVPGVMAQARRNLVSNGLQENRDFHLIEADLKEIDVLQKKLRLLPPFEGETVILSNIGAAWAEYNVMNLDVIRLIPLVGKATNSQVTGFVGGGYQEPVTEEHIYDYFRNSWQFRHYDDGELMFFVVMNSLRRMREKEGGYKPIVSDDQEALLQGFGFKAEAAEGVVERVTRDGTFKFTAWKAILEKPTSASSLGKDLLQLLLYIAPSIPIVYGAKLLIQQIISVRNGHYEYPFPSDPQQNDDRTLGFFPPQPTMEQIYNSMNINQRIAFRISKPINLIAFSASFLLLLLYEDLSFLDLVAAFGAGYLIKSILKRLTHLLMGNHPFRAFMKDFERGLPVDALHKQDVEDVIFDSRRYAGLQLRGDQIWKSLNYQKGERLLELGPGFGAISLKAALNGLHVILAEHPASHYLPRLKENIARMQKAIEEAGGSIQLIEGNVLDHETQAAVKKALDENRLDHVMALDVLRPEEDEKKTQERLKALEPMYPNRRLLEAYYGIHNPKDVQETLKFLLELKKSDRGTLYLNHLHSRDSANPLLEPGEFHGLPELDRLLKEKGIAYTSVQLPTTRLPLDAAALYRFSGLGSAEQGASLGKVSLPTRGKLELSRVQVASIWADGFVYMPHAEKDAIQSALDKITENSWAEEAYFLGPILFRFSRQNDSRGTFQSAA